MTDASLNKRLRNWGEWLNYDAEIAPPDAKCISIESRYIPEAGDVWEPEPEIHVVPDVTDAEHMEKLISSLDCAERWALACRYGGAGAVMRWRRMGEHALEKLADNAEVLLADMVRAAA